MRVYLDASALAKLFLSEVGTPTVLRLLQSDVACFASRLSFVEVGHAISRHLLEGRLDQQEAETGLELLLDPRLRIPEIVELDAVVEAKAVALLRTHPLRGADAVHLASALVARADVLVTSDSHLLRSAPAEGLSCLNPLVSDWPPDDE